jgi:phosphoadenosine phosphosulfate reductase
MNDLFTGKSKEEIAIERIKAFCPPEGYYVAFSGGKDSIVILDLVKRAGVPFDAHYNFSGGFLVNQGETLQTQTRP